MRHRKSILFVLFLAFALTAMGQQAAQDHKILFEKAKFTMETKGDLKGAITLFGDIIKKYPKEREYAAKSQLYIGMCYEKLGTKEAQKAYESVLANYADQAEPTKVARERLSVLTYTTVTTKANTEVAMRRIWEAGSNWPFGFSPDGKYVVYTDSEDNDIWLRDLKSGEKKRITKETSTYEWTGPSGDAAISPDGKQIAYSWWVRSYGEVRLCSIDGTSTKLIHSGKDGKSMYPKAWMPDGNRILAVSFDRKEDRYQRNIISITDGSITIIGKPEKDDIKWGSPSPDGHFVAYGLRGDIFIYDMSTGKDTILIQNPETDNLVGWTPDGSGILFVSNRSGTYDLYMTKIINCRSIGKPEKLKEDIGTNKKLYLTNDGRLFRVDNTGSSNSFILQVNQQSGKLEGTPTPVDGNYPNAYYTGWSPDGKLFFYQTEKGPADKRTRILVIRTEETGQLREITPKPHFPHWYRPVLSPDGKRFAVTGTNENNNFGVFAIDAQSGEVSQLAKIPTENEPVDPAQNWSPDGKAIYYKVRSFEKSEGFILKRKDLVTGEEKDLNKGIHTMDMKISPDGSRFVYYRIDTPNKSNVMGILDLRTGKELELLRATNWISGPTWMPDGKHVMVGRNVTKGSELWKIPISGGQGEKLYDSPYYNFDFVMNPGGTRVAFTQSYSKYELWIMENFLPEK